VSPPRRACLIVAAVATAVAVIPGDAAADLVEDPCACSAAKPGFFRRDKLTGDWDDHRTALEHAGVVLQGTYSVEAFAARHLATPVVVGGLFVVSVDVDAAALLARGLGALHVSALAIHGGGLTAELMDVYGVSGNAAPDDVRLFEGWYEQPVGALHLRAGLLSADQEFVLARHSSALMNATFGITSQLSYNLLGPVYPIATPGVSARVEGSWLTGRAALYDGDQHNVHGVPTSTPQTALALGEVEVAQLVKLGAWHHGTKGDGGYAIVDHELEARVAAFARAGYSPSQPVSMYLDAGIRLGPGPLRPKDFAGVGVAFARTDHGAEIVYELTYQAQLGWLTIQPDLQVLLQRERTTAIVATRVTIVL
jgi:carbohydrate-selective porin OprB